MTNEINNKNILYPILNVINNMRTTMRHNQIQEAADSALALLKENVYSKNS